MPSVWFATPAFRRYEVSKVCFAHRAWTMEKMRERGIDARCVIVADDENLDLARSFGFDTHERANDFLGARWNDGYEYAARNGADFIVPIGSDSWIHPDFMLDLPDQDGSEFLTSRYYAIVDEQGQRLARLEIEAAGGVGPYVIPTKLMARARYRPVSERLQRGCDGSLMRGLGIRNLRGVGHYGITFRWSDVHPLQYFAFRVRGEQLNPYALLAHKYAVSESNDVWRELEQIHPRGLVADARKVYEQKVLA